MGQLAVIGGGFDGQIHNTLEAAANHCLPLFGPFFSRAAEAKKLIELGCALTFENRKEFLEFLCRSMQVDFKNIQQNQKELNYVFDNIKNTGEIVFQKINGIEHYK